jgi:PAS domain S-box-containing protein
MLLTPLKDNTGTVTLVLSLLRTIHDQPADKHLQNALRNAEEESNRIKAIINAIGDAVSIQDTNFRVLFQNKAHKDLVGEHSGEICYKAYSNREAICDACPIATTFKDGLVHTVEKKGVIEKGILSVEITASPLKDAEGNIIAGIEVVRDITSRRKTEEGLRRAEEQFRTLVEQALVGIYIYQDGFFPYVNPKAAEIFGYTQEEISSEPFESLIAEADQPDSRKNIRKLLDKEVTSTHSFISAIRKNGTTVELETQSVRTEYRGKPAIMGTFIDITERKKMETAFRNVQRLESLSAFASGVALEYNNILTAIIGNLALAKMYAKPGYEVFDVLTEAEKASMRAKDLTSQLLSFSEGGSPVRKIVYLQELIRDLVSLSGDSKTAHYEMTLPENLWPVEVDESQLGQAINSLLINARNATPEGGTIRISADNIPLGSSTGLPLKQCRYIMITIEDQGKDMSGKEVQTIFDPFQPGEKKGGGLGLASSYTIVRKHDGIITADSSPGEGTIYRVYLPAVQENSTAPSGSSVISRSRRGMVLVMDDEEIVRVVVNRLLLQCGFETELAKDGVEMLRLYREAKEAGKTFEAVILDLIIQEGMGGQEAIKQLLAYDPDVKVIVSSGYSHNPIMTNFREYGFAGFLPKPYKLEELRRIMNEITSAAR